MAITPENERALFWYVVIHMAFVVSSVLLALSDRIAGHAGPAKPAAAGDSHKSA